MFFRNIRRSYWRISFFLWQQLLMGVALAVKVEEPALQEGVLVWLAEQALKEEGPQQVVLEGRLALKAEVLVLLVEDLALVGEVQALVEVVSLGGLVPRLL